MWRRTCHGDVMSARSRSKRDRRKKNRTGPSSRGSQNNAKHDLASAVKSYLASPRVTDDDEMAKRRPTGQLWPVGPDEKKWAREQMKERGISQADLSRLVKTSTAMISLFFDEENPRPVRHSRLWPRIVEVLGGQAPTVTSPAGDGAHQMDEARRALLDNYDKLSADQQRIVNELVRSLTPKRQ